MFRTIHPITRPAAVALSALALLSLGTPAQAATWSLAEDFSLGSNPNGAWIYQLEVTPDDLDTAYTPLNTNSLTANNIWGTTFATPPTMRSDAAGYWGIGKNDTGATQTSSNVFWDAGEVLLHPRNDFAGSGGRFVATWVAPSDMTVDVNWAYAKRSLDGANGVGMGVLRESGGVNSTLRPFADPNGAAGMFNDLTVSAGDKLHFRFDNWGEAGGDITWAEVRVNEVASDPKSVIFSENFNSYAGTQNATQTNTNLEVAFGGTVSGWSSSGGNAMHAVDLANPGGQDNPSDWAIMFYADNVITQAGGITGSNILGREYELTFDYGTANYSGPQQTGASDGLLVEILRADNSVLTFGEFFPGAWDSLLDFNLNEGLVGTISYFGDGTGDIRLRIGPSGPLTTGRFEGEIDNLVLQVSAAPVPEPSSMVLLGMGLLGFCGYRRVRGKSACAPEQA